MTPKERGRKRGAGGRDGVSSVGGNRPLQERLRAALAPRVPGPRRRRASTDLPKTGGPMKPTLTAAVALALAVSLGAGAAHAGQKPALGGQSDEITLSGDEVLLDIVATDGKGRPVLDLRPDEVEVYEDGQKQSVTSFGLVQVGATAGGAPAAGAATGRLPSTLTNSPFRNYNLIMIVVDLTSVQKTNLDLTYKAAEKFINDKLQPNDLVAVFGAASSGLGLFQNFTNDKARLLNAMKRVTANADPFTQSAGAYSSGRVYIAGTPPASGPNNPDDRPQPDSLGVDVISQDLNRLSDTVTDTLTDLRSQLQARWIVYDLLALTKTYAQVPGRKSVVLYSEGFNVTSTVDRAFDSAIGSANRNNFVFYTVDAAGLRGNLSTNTGTSVDTGASDPTRDRSLVTGGNSDLGKAEVALRSNDNGALTRLASETGGVALRNNNDLGRGFTAVANDLRSYYALAYSPTNASMNGQFRNVSVKILRKGVDVRTRSGYYAVPGGNGAIVLPYEQPVLAMLTSASSGGGRSELPVTVKTERFRGDGGWIVPIVMTVDAASLAQVPDSPEAAQNPQAPANFEVDTVAVVRDENHNVVAKLGRPTTYQVPRDKVAQFHAEKATGLPGFSQPLILGPGTYTITFGFYDPISKRGTVTERQVKLPALPAAGSPGMSTVALAYTAVPASAQEATSSDPFIFDGKARIVPNATGQYVKSRGDKLIPYFRVYGDANKVYDVKLTFLHNNQVVTATKPTPLPATNAKGETAFAPVLPLDSFEPGSYLVQVAVTESGGTTPVANAMATFRVDP